MTLCAVLGRPIEHSLSPTLHRAAHVALGLDWAYEAYDVGVAELPEFMTRVQPPRWRGLSLTMPLKHAVVDEIDEVEDLARTLQAVNTVVVEVDGRRRGYNTDVPGLVAAFAEHGVHQLDAVSVLGGGATAGSVLAATARMGAQRAHVYVRDPRRAARLEELGERLRIRTVVEEWSRVARAPLLDAVVSTIPASAQGDLPIRWAALATVLLDVGYDPTPTAFMAAAAADGLDVIGGFAMLLHQAAAQVELMTGVPVAPVAAMRTAGLARLAASSTASGPTSTEMA